MMLVHFGTRLEGANGRAAAAGAGGAAGLGPDVRPPGGGARSAGRAAVGGRVLVGAAASAWWAEQAKSRRAGLEMLAPGPSGGDELPTVVILRADRAASYGAVRRTLAEAQEQGFAHFSLVVLRRDTAMSFGMGMPASTAADPGHDGRPAAAAVAPRSRRYRPGLPTRSPSR